MGRFLARRPIWVLAIVVMVSIFYGIITDHMMIHDTRLQAEEWIDANIPAGKTIEMNWGHTMFPFVADSHTVNIIPLLDQTDYASLVYDLTTRHPEYVVLSSLHYDRFLHENQYPELMNPIYDAIAPFQSRNPTLTTYFSDLIAEKLGYRKIAEFKRPVLLPSPEFVDPTIVILKRID